MKGRKLLIPIATFVLALSMGLAACGNAGNQSEGGGGNSQSEPPAKQEKISVEAEGGKKSLILGEKVQLTAKVGDAVLEGVTWESAKPEIASVDANGLVTSVSKGSATIKAIKDGYKDGSISISVDYETIKVSVAEGGKTSLLVGETVQLNADKQGVTWASSDATIAEVSNTGLVTAKKIGSATITASGNNLNPGSQAISVVRPAPTATLHWEDADHYSTNDDWSSSGRGGGETPVYTPNGGEPSDGTCIAYFENGDKETLTFTCDKAVKAEIVATMLYRSTASDLGACFTAKVNDSDDILFTGVAYPGDYAIFELSLGEHNLKNGDNTVVINFLGSSPYFDDLNIYAAETANIAVKLPAAKPDVVVNQESLTVVEGKTVQITSSMTELSYRSASESIATVDTNGIVTGVKAGETTITVSKDGYKSAKVPVTVTEAEGVIKVEAEQNQEQAEAAGISFRTPSSSSGASGAVTKEWPVDAVLSVTFEDTAVKTYALYLVGRANGGSTGYTYTDVNLATGIQVTVNDGDPLTLSGTISGSTITPYLLGNIISKVGSNTISVKCLELAPTIDFFKLIPVA